MAHPSQPIAIIGTQNVDRIAEIAMATSVNLTRADVYSIVQASDGVPLP
jgi:predicted oxidoreductase